MFRLLIFFVILIICDSAYAREPWRYTSFRFVEATTADHLPTTILVGKKTFESIMPRGSATHPLWGVEQVYATDGFKRKIIVKRDVQLTEKWPVGGWAKVGKGYVLHIKRGESITAHYVVGFDNRERLEIERQLRKAYKSASLGDWFLPSANAGELLGPSSGSSGGAGSMRSIPTSQLTADIAKEFEAPGIQADSFVKCIATTAGTSLANKGQSAWEKTKAAAVATYEDPMGAAKAAGSSAKDLGSTAWDKTKSGVKAGVEYAGEAIGDPSKIYDDVSASIDRSRQAGDEIYKQVKSAIKEIEEWPTPVKNAVLCQIAGRLAAERAIGLVAGFTGIGLSIAYTQAMKLMKEILDGIKNMVPLIQAILHAREMPAKERFELIKEYVEGKKSKEQVELALSRHRKTEASSDDQQVAASAPGRRSAAVAEASSLKNLSPSELKDLQRRNRAERSPNVRMQKIEKLLGLPEGRLASRLDANGKETNQERIKLLAIHEKKCARSECTAREVMTIKEFDKVRTMFPSVPVQRVNDLYRANLLGVDNLEGDRQFAQLLRQPLKPREQVAAPAAGARLSSRRSDLEKLDGEVERLKSDPNHSPIQMLEARRQRDLTRRDVASLEFKSFKEKSEGVGAATGSAEFQSLLQKPMRPSPERTVADREDRGGSGESKGPNAAETILKQAEDREAIKAASDEARRIAATEGDSAEFKRLLSRPHRSSAQRSPLEVAVENVRSATPERPVRARYVSPQTGRVIDGEVIGLKAPGETGLQDRVFIRTRTEDGRTATREIKIEDLAFGRDGKPVRETTTPGTADEVVARLAQEASSSEKKLRALEGESEELRRSGRMTNADFDRITRERARIERTDAPLFRQEIAEIEAVSGSFTREKMRERLPLNITPTGDIEVRPGVFNRSRVELTPAEKADLERVKGFVNSRNGAPRAQEDVVHFKKVESLNEQEIVRGRIRERQSEAANRITKFTGGSAHELPPTSTFNRYRPYSLIKAYGSSPSSSVKSSLQKVHDIVTKRNHHLSTEEVREIQGALRTLRSNQSVVESNPDLRDFLDYARDRAAHSTLQDFGANLGK